MIDEGIYLTIPNHDLSIYKSLKNYLLSMA